jgi:tetratricopeptide (TPR) repeat protein
MKWYLALLPILVVCQCARRPSSADALYREADALRRRGVVLEAIAVADRGWQPWKNQPGAEWHWKFRLLKAELLLNQGLGTQARELLEARGETPPSGELRARYWGDLGEACQDPALLEKAFGIASHQDYWSLIPTIQLRRARLDGYTSRSEALIKNALAVAQGHGDAYLETAALIVLGFQRSSNSRFDEAIPWFERAESVARGGGIVRLRERALGNLGRCYYHLGDFDRAADSLSLAIALARQVADDDYLHRWLNDIGSVYYRRREFDRAISNYQASADLARSVNNESAVIMALKQPRSNRLRPNRPSAS